MNEYRAMGAWIAIGIGIGAALGVAMNNIGLWIAIGVVLGVVVGAGHRQIEQGSLLNAAHGDVLQRPQGP